MARRGALLAQRLPRPRPLCPRAHRQAPRCLRLRRLSRLRPSAHPQRLRAPARRRRTPLRRRPPVVAQRRHLPDRRVEPGGPELQSAPVLRLRAGHIHALAPPPVALSHPRALPELPRRPAEPIPSSSGQDGQAPWTLSRSRWPCSVAFMGPRCRMEWGAGSLPCRSAPQRSRRPARQEERRRSTSRAARVRRRLRRDRDGRVSCRLAGWIAVRRAASACAACAAARMARPSARGCSRRWTRSRGT